MARHFEVYICRLDGDIVYIGSGANGRHKHCNSGCSHVYDLNRLHFEGKTFDVQVKKFNDKQESLDNEKELILKHKPKYNSVYLSKERSAKGSKSLELKALFRKEIMRYFHKQQEIEDYGKVFLEFLQHHNVQDMVEKSELIMHPRFYYKNNTSDKLFSTYRSYMEGAVSCNSRGYKFFSCVISVLNSVNNSKINHVPLYS